MKTSKAISRFTEKYGKAPMALVTGGSSGMGLEYARQLAAAGCPVVLVSNQEKELSEAKKMLEEEYGVKVDTRFQNLATATAADELFAWCNEQGYEIDILISNAGMFFFEELTESNSAKAEAMVNLHVVTPSRLLVLFGNAMKARRRGYMISMSSLAARLPMPGITIYAASKAYLRSFGRSLFFEMRPYGVVMTTVCPAAIATPLYNLREDLMKLALSLGVIKTPGWLVKRALRGMFSGKRMIQPGLMNIYLPVLISILPRHNVNRLWQKFK